MKNSQVPPNKKDKKIPPKSAVIKKRLFFVMIGLVLIIPLASFGIYETGRHSGWWGDSDSVRALRREPMAAKDLLGMELVHSQETPRAEDNYKSYPYMRRWFEVPEGEDMEVAMEKVVDAAVKDGWEKQKFEFKDSEWYGKKTSQEEQNMNIYIKLQIPSDNDPYYNYRYKAPVIIVRISI